MLLFFFFFSLVSVFRPNSRHSLALYSLYIGVVYLCGHKFSNCLRSVQKLSTFDSDVRINRLYVHVDFKGSPPKPQYLLECFPLWKRWGATGVVFEWEDMLPFEGRLERIRKSYCYTKDEVALLVGSAEKQGLHCIPLVQTFGHLEFVLKHAEFSAFRENPKEVLNLCPLHEGSEALARELIDQTLQFHPLADTIHIGCDEVFHLGTCEKCRLKAMSEGIENVFVDHVQPLLEYCSKTLRVRPLIWHDMMEAYPSNVLSEKLGNIGEPVLWHYGDVSQLSDSVWDKLYQAFPRVWGATAFKGAAEPDAVWTPLHQRFANHLSWMEKAVLLKEQSRSLEAIVVTGWSRFSHNSALCEILPAALPSLCVCLRMLQNAHFSSNLIEEVGKELGIPEYALLFDNTSLDMGVEMKVNGNSDGNRNNHHHRIMMMDTDVDDSDHSDGNEQEEEDSYSSKGTSKQEMFPGRDLYFSLARVEAARQLYLKSSSESDFAVNNCIENLCQLREELLRHLSRVLYKEDVEEIMATKFDNIVKNLKRRLEHTQQ